MPRHIYVRTPEGAGHWLRLVYLSTVRIGFCRARPGTTLHDEDPKWAPYASDPAWGLWDAFVGRQNKCVYVGTFDDPDDGADVIGQVVTKRGLSAALQDGRPLDAELEDLALRAWEQVWIIEQRKRHRFSDPVGDGHEVCQHRVYDPWSGATRVVDAAAYIDHALRTIVELNENIGLLRAHVRELQAERAALTQRP